MLKLKFWITLTTLCSLLLAAQAQTTKPAPAAAAKKPVAAVPAAKFTEPQMTLYVVPYAHLDTQWRWDYPATIGQHLSNTMRQNFALFEKYPHYTFNFSGANRYRMMKEYYPADYAILKKYVAAGRWFPAGSSMEEEDVNNPSGESLIRQILYGTEYFRHDFGKTSEEFMLPDCFGFPASLPSILAHMGLKGFSTQKLTWRSGTRAGGPGSPQETPEGIPFNVGYWKGPDGRGVIAALNASDYGSDVKEDLTTSPFWTKRAENNGKPAGLFVDYRYYGTGDIGGSPREPSVAMMEAILTKGKATLPGSTTPVQVGLGKLRIVQGNSDQMFKDIPASAIANMPTYQGDLELIEHSAGSLTSQAYMKKWNHRNELLADAAERASVAAAWLGGRTYPQERLLGAWNFVMGGQFHDMIPGTSIPHAYELIWNDEVLAMNQFGEVLTSATESIAGGLNTDVKGTAVVVYNSLNIPRQDVVEAAISFPDGMPNAVRVTGPDGKVVPAQLRGHRVLFLASMPPVGYAVYSVEPSEMIAGAVSDLKVSESSLENARYKVGIDQNGDISSIFDKKLNKEILSTPARLALKTDAPADWPAWNMDWAQQKNPPRAYVAGPAKVKVVENGPARVAVRVTREQDGSKFAQTIRLSAGDGGNRVEIANSIDWHTAESNLKAFFSFTAANPQATYNWDVGTIQRSNGDDHRFEVGSHQWFDLTDKSGAFGVTVLTGAKNGSSKPNDNTVALTLMRSPGINDKTRWVEDEASQDWGHHDLVYGLASHEGDWRKEQTEWQGFRMDSPLVAFESSKHAGTLGSSFSLMKIDNPGVRVLALKKAEESDEIVLRMVELEGQQRSNVHVAFAAPILSAREVNGQERPLGTADVVKGELVTKFDPYQPRTFALKLAPPKAQLAAKKSEAVLLTYDRSVATPDGRPAYGSFDDVPEQGSFGGGQSALPAEMLPHQLEYDGVVFKLAPAMLGKPNSVSTRGQSIALPAGKFNAIYLLTASSVDDQKAAFAIDGKSTDFIVPSWGGYIGQWDDRKWKTIELPLPAVPAADDNSEAAKNAREVLKAAEQSGPPTKQVFDGLKPAYIKQAPVAWFASHRHKSDGSNEIYAFSYLHAVRLPIEPGAKSITLPNNSHLRILAITVAEEPATVKAAQSLGDPIEERHGREQAAAH